MFNAHKPKLNIDDLYEHHRVNNEHRVKLYNRVLAQIHNRIKLANKHATTKEVMYKIPYILLGEKLYVYNDCIQHVVQNLTENGFIVEVESNCVYISWAHWIPSFIRTELSKKGIYVDALGNTLSPTNEISETASDANPPPDPVSNSRYKPISAYTPKRVVMYDEDLLRQTEMRLRK